MHLALEVPRIGKQAKSGFFPLLQGFATAFPKMASAIDTVIQPKHQGTECYYHTARDWLRVVIRKVRELFRRGGVRGTFL